MEPGPRQPVYQAMVSAAFNAHFRAVPHDWYSIPETLLVEAGCFRSLEGLMSEQVVSITRDVADDKDFDEAIATLPEAAAAAESEPLEQPLVKHTFFRVVDWRPSRLKILRQRGRPQRKLSSTALAVSVHGYGGTLGSGVVVESEPRHLQQESVSPIMIVDKLADLVGDDMFQEHFLAWSDSSLKQETLLRLSTVPPISLALASPCFSSPTPGPTPPKSCGASACLARPSRILAFWQKDCLQHSNVSRRASAS
jgi:hypothetical protein